MRQRLRRGFTLIELLVAMAIAVILLVLAVPGYVTWMGDQEILNAAQSVSGGLQTALGEAIKRNENVEFVLDKTTGTGGWTVQRASDASVVQKGAFVEGANRVVFAPGPATKLTTLTFTGVGQVASKNGDGSDPFDSINITSGVTGTRPLTVLAPSVSKGRSGVKICDPKFPSTDPKGCPP